MELVKGCEGKVGEKREAGCVQTIPSKKILKDIHCSSCANLDTLNRVFGLMFAKLKKTNFVWRVQCFQPDNDPVLKQLARCPPTSDSFPRAYSLIDSNE